MNTKQTEQKDSVLYLPAAGMLNLTHAILEAVDCTISQETFTTGPTEIQKSHDRLLSPITSKCTTCDHFKVHHFGWAFSD